MPDPRDEALAVAKKTIEEQDKFIKQLAEQAAPYATVALVAGDKTLLASGGDLVEVNTPEFKVSAGDAVSVVKQTGQILALGRVTALPGNTAVVSSVDSDTGVTLESSGEKKFAFKRPDLALEKGDTVLLDSTSRVVVMKRESAAKQYVRTGTGVCWDDIGGLVEAKRQMREIIELPFQQPELFKHYGYTPPRGVLLSGPPGCGKTMLGKAAATAIARAHKAEDGFIYVKGPEVLNKYVGESESRVRSIFDQARLHKKRTGAPALVFIDEAEALLSSRGIDRRAGGMEGTIVPTFLAEMDGIEESAAVVVLATNRPEQLDTAVVRDGRIDRKIEITRPDLQTIADVAHIYFLRTPTRVPAEDLAREVAREMMSRPVYELQTTHGLMRMHLQDLASGAMIANLVEKAKSRALRRDMAEKTMTGVGAEDLAGAVDELMSETRRIDHSEEVSDFLRKQGADLVSATRIAA